MRLRIAEMVYGLTPSEAEELAAGELYLLKEAAPLNLDPNSPDNVLLERERSFEQLCAAIEENMSGAGEAGALPAFRFYARWAVLHERAKALEKLKTKK